MEVKLKGMENNLNSRISQLNQFSQSIKLPNTIKIKSKQRDLKMLKIIEEKLR